MIWLYVLAFAVGFLFGVGTMCLMRVAAKADDDLGVPRG
jgi:hypothetical protein